MKEAPAPQAGAPSILEPARTTDAELVQAFVQHRQDAALVELVRRHQIPVYRRLSVTLADPDNAQAVTESVFVIASRRLGEWPKDSDFQSWLLELAEEVSAAHPGEPADASSPRLVDPAAFFKHAVHRALHSLPSDERAILLAVDLEGESVEQVAFARTASIESVTDVLNRARQHFTRVLSVKEDRSESPGRALRVVPGEIVDRRYLVESVLGQGGMATVFRAEHLGIKRKVALKTLHPTHQTQAMLRERFVREAEVLGKLSHPNFVDISDFGESSRGVSFLIMELLDGHALAEEVRHGKLAPARAVALARQICNGLAFAHEKGIIHRDIKPDNVMVVNGAAEEGSAKILDLGIASTETDSDFEGGDALYGTPAYMAPEQIRGERIDGRTDLYSLGVTLFELLTGELPFQGSAPEYLLAQHLTREPPRLKDLEPELPELDALQELLDQCLAKDPNARVRDAKTLARRLEALLPRLGAAEPAQQGFMSSPAAKPPQEPTSPARLARPRRSRIAVIAVIAVIALVALVLFLWARHGQAQ